MSSAGQAYAERVVGPYQATDRRAARGNLHLSHVERAPQPAQLLGKLAPVGERRLAASMLAGMTRTLRLNLYRSWIDLRFEAGRLVAVEHAPVNTASVVEVRLPPPLLAPLITGYRTFEALASASHDVSADGSARSLAAILFPQTQAFLDTIY